MDCERFLELLSAQLDGELTEEETRKLEDHLAVCPDCRAAGARLSALREAFPELEDVPAPQGFARGVMERIREETRPKVVPLFQRPRFRALAGLAACLAVVVGLYTASRPRHLDKREIIDVTARSFSQDAVSGEPEDAPQIAAYAVPAPEDSGTTEGVEKAAAPDPAADGMEDDRPLMEGTTTLERMPEGAAELIPPETVVMPMDGQGGNVYLDLPLEVLDEIERLAQEQGIGITAERCSAPGAEVVYNLEILQPNQ